MALPALLSRLRLPLIGAPLFIVSVPELVIAQCCAGVVGSLPALNARPSAELDDWLSQIRQALADWDAAHPQTPAAPFAVNLIVHRGNPRLQQDLALCQKHAVPLLITSLGAQPEVNQAAHGWGGLVLHDVIDDRFARKAIDKGADGLIAVAAGAGGHAGRLSPFALVQEIRAWFDGPLALAGAIASGDAVLAAQAIGADLAYCGSPFIATTEARAAAVYKQMLVDGSSADIVGSALFTGIWGNYLRGSIVAAGLDPEHLPDPDPGLDVGALLAGNQAWKDIWGCGQGIAAVDAVLPAAELVARLQRQYQAARQRLCAGGA